MIIKVLDCDANRFVARYLVGWTKQRTLRDEGRLPQVLYRIDNALHVGTTLSRVHKVALRG